MSEATSASTMRKMVVTTSRAASSLARSDSHERRFAPWPAGLASRPMLSQPQAVPHPALGVDHRRAERIQLAPQVADVGLDDLRLARIIPAPDILQQLFPGQHPAI